MPTNDEIREILEQAGRAVEDSKLPEEFRIAAFEKAVDILLGGSTSQPAVRPTPDGQIGNGPPADNPLAQLASMLGIDVDLVSEVFYVDDAREVQIGISTGQLESAKTAATRQIALLLAAGRQGAGVESSTAADTIRAAAGNFKKLDGSNFATTLQEMSGEFIFEGSSRQRRVRLKRSGYESAAALVRQLCQSAEQGS